MLVCLVLLGTRSGMNFGLIASRVFGTKGFAVASGLLSTLLLGWYAVQTGITGALVSSTYGLNYVLMTVVAGLLYIGVTFIGVRGLHWIGLVSVPLFVILGLFVAFHAASTTTWSAIMDYAGNNGTATMSMGDGLTVVIALFADAGTVTPDFNRWARTGSDFGDLDLQRFSVRQSRGHAGRRRHDSGARRAERQSVRNGQYVRLHEQAGHRGAERYRVYLPVR